MMTTKRKPHRPVSSFVEEFHGSRWLTQWPSGGEAMGVQRKHVNETGATIAGHINGLRLH